MTEARNVFNFGAPQTVPELTRILGGFFQRISERLDRQEGLRGNPRFYSGTFEFPGVGLTVGSVLKASSSAQASFDTESESVSSGSDLEESQLIGIYDFNEELIHQFPLELLACSSDTMGFQ